MFGIWSLISRSTYSFLSEWGDRKNIRMQLCVFSFAFFLFQVQMILTVWISAALWWSVCELLNKRKAKKKKNQLQRIYVQHLSTSLIQSLLKESKLIIIIYTHSVIDNVSLFVRQSRFIHINVNKCAFCIWRFPETKEAVAVQGVYGREGSAMRPLPFSLSVEPFILSSPVEKFARPWPRPTCYERRCEG